MSNKLVFLLSLSIICISLVLLAPVACTMNRQAVIERAVKNGADPIAMKCSLESSEGRSDSMCVIRATTLVKQ